jgi:hypothetical protein
MAEDAIIYRKAFTTLIFFMVVTSKGYMLRESDVSWILGLVSAIASEKRKRSPDFERRDFERLDCEAVFKSPHRDYLYALGLRKAFGGSSGDVGLIENALIEARKEGWKGADADIKKVADFKSLELKAHEWELSAIDFHGNLIVSNAFFQCPTFLSNGASSCIQKIRTWMMII